MLSFLRPHVPPSDDPDTSIACVARFNQIVTDWSECCGASYPIQLSRLPFAAFVLSPTAPFLNYTFFNLDKSPLDEILAPLVVPDVCSCVTSYLLTNSASCFLAFYLIDFAIRLI